MEPRQWGMSFDAPAKLLNANTRLHRMTVYKLTRAWRAAAWQYAMAHRPVTLDRAHVTITLHFTDRRRRDVHNYYGTVKAIVDGLVDAGLLPDDRDEHLVLDLRTGPPARGALVPRIDVDAVELPAVRETA